MLSDVLELIYTDSRGNSHELPLEEWQFQAIVQLLGLSVKEETDSLKITCFAKQDVAKRIKKMGILVTPDQYEKMKGNHDDTK